MRKTQAPDRFGQAARRPPLAGRQVDTMNNGVFVKIDVERLRRRLSAATGREMEPQDVNALLKRWGFTVSDNWYCDGAKLGVLEADEVLEQTTDDTDGAMLVSRRSAGPNTK
jgi:hypothetical protein